MPGTTEDDISLVGIFKPRERITWSATWVYGTGNAITLPQAEFLVVQHYPTMNFSNYIPFQTDFGPKNGFRMAPYHRLDLGVQFHKKKRWGERTWEISVYNMYNRMNPFFYYLETNRENDFLGERTLKQQSLFPIIPSVSYGFKF